MKLFDLKGKEHKIIVRASDYPMRSQAACRSKLQYLVGQALKVKYPYETILEDFRCPDGFYLDFFIPSKMLAYEIQGKQHDEFVPFFHKNQKGFNEHKDRDYRKQQFCDKNSIKLNLIYTEEDVSNV